MTPAIRVDEQVYSWLQSQAKAFEDSPNSVLRRVAGLDSAPTSSSEIGKPRDSARLPLDMKRLTGLRLAKLWGVNVRHALYHRDGTFYENLTRFPGALFDPGGYVVFKSEEDYKRSQYLNRGEKLNVPRGISSLPGYTRRKR
jgi:hypothetical protein